ncbi:MAG: TIGR03905 family TSCPD domain-containing protein [Lachnospiraceae bacterium]|nr:TIGR03905 family TSCPD domain-containing protein [Lachnospiraceae bacterium]
MNYKTRGTCAQMISFDVKDGKVTDVQFLGGCHGNTQGVSRLVEGMSVDEVISRLEGIRCGHKPTSCPDQLAQALKAWQAKQA